MSHEFEAMNLSEILLPGITIDHVHENLLRRVKKNNGNRDVLEKGKMIKRKFPEACEETVKLANQAIEGMLLLPGTGPQLYYVGNPPKWKKNPCGDDEFTYFLNRMYHWKNMAEAYSITGDETYARKVLCELENWIDTCPCIALKDQDGSYRLKEFDCLGVWRALEVGIRGYLTWPLMIELLAATNQFTKDLLGKIVCCVYMHCKVLYEIAPRLWPDADMNHYLMENLGLMALSSLFPEMKHSQLFLGHSHKELDRCMKAQCTPCGAQIEGCPSYHNGCIFWFAMRLVFANQYDYPVPQEYILQLKKMFVHSVYATRPCGGNVPWGDSHIDRETLPLAAISCYLAYNDAEYLQIAMHFYSYSVVLDSVRDNLWRFFNLEKMCADLDFARVNPKQPDCPCAIYQEDVQQVYARSSWTADALSVMTACRTPIQNDHAHIDAGGFDLCANGEPLIVDPGIYTYKDDEHRARFKSAPYHNCLTVEMQNMWEYISTWEYGPQKEGRILQVTQSENLVCVVSEHYNYEPVVALRVLAMVDNSFLLVVDKVDNATHRKLEINYHVDRVSLVPQDSGVVSCDAGRSNVLMQCSRMPNMLVVEDAKVSTMDDVWHDSKIVRFCYIPEESVFCNASLIVPLAKELSADCYDAAGVEQSGDCIVVTLPEKTYHFSFRDKALTLISTETKMK